MPRRHAEMSRCIVTIGRRVEMFSGDTSCYNVTWRENVIHTVLGRHVETSHGHICEDVTVTPNVPIFYCHKN